MNHLLKNTVRFALGTCFTLGAATVAASVVAGSHVGKIVSAGFRGSGAAVQNPEATAEETGTDEIKTSPEGFEK